MNPSRRSFLRSATGASLALPWFESIAGGSPAQIPQRLAIFYVPIGVVRRAFFPGEIDTELLKFGQETRRTKLGKTALEPGFHPLELTPTIEPLAPVKDRITLITGLDRVFQSGTDVHAQCGCCFLSSAGPYEIKQSAWPLDRTLDQIVGDSIGRNTPFRTIELSCNSHKDNLESIHFDNISWYGTGHVAPSIRDPRKAYERLFGTSRARDHRAVTDLVLADARDMKRQLGHDDQQKFGEYFEAIRSIEQQMDRLEAMRSEIAEVEFELPPEAHLPRGEYIRLMGDLMVVALQAGLTNVATLMVGPERWATPFTYEGVFDRPLSHHEMSHNQRKYEAELRRLDRFHMEQFAYLVQRMDAIQEADGQSLLDHTLFTYGSGLGDGATHQYNRLPIIVAGKGSGRFIDGGRHLHCPDGTPLANLWLAQAHALGLERQRFADSTKPLSQIMA